ncbi:MAG: Ig-like domain-containing protein [Paludibacteraceae bacterium]|nr:Ig-like domain-containing protein [Paludibacteraceae bacterium]
MRKILSLITALVLCTTMWGAEVPVTSITVNPGSYDLEKGYKSTLKVTVLPQDATDPSVTWSTSDATIVTVDADGTIHYKKDGVVTITATANDGSNVKGTCTVYAGQFVYNDTPLIEGFVNSGTYTISATIDKLTPVSMAGQTIQIGTFSTHPEKAEKRIRITNFGAGSLSQNGVTIDIKWFPANDSLYIVNKQLIGKQNGSGYDLYIAGRGYFKSDAANTSHIDRATGTLYLDADYFYYKTSGGSASTYTRKTDILQLEKTPRTLYLNTGGSKLWNQANAKFSAYYWADGVEGKFTGFLTAIEGNADIFVATIPADMEKVIFVRHANDATKAEWNDTKVWNQTEDLTLLADKDMYTITAWGQETKVCLGEWSVYGGAVEKPKHDYTITAYLPAFCDDIAAYADSIRVMGGFDDWSNGIYMQKIVDEDFNDCWVAEIKDVEEGTEFKLRFGMDADWKVQVQLNGANMANEAFGETTDIVLHYDGEGYGFAACAAPVARKEFVFVAGETAYSDPAIFAITWGKDGSNETVKLANKADDIYTAEILETVDSLVLVRCASDATEIIWDGEGMNVWNQTANYELCDTMYFESWVPETNLFAVTCEAPKPIETKYYAKNNWDGGEWSWKEMTKVEDLYVLDSVVFGGTGININSKEDDTDAKWFALKDMTYVGEDTIQALDTVRFELSISDKDTVLTAILLGRPAPVARKEFVFVAGEAAESDPALFAITWGKDGSNETVKLANKADDIYTAEILETVDSLVLVRCASDATEIIWDGEGMNVWNQTANYELCDTMYFESWVPETNLFAVTCEAPKPIETKYYAKNNWNGATEWSWLEMSATDQENVYMLDSVVFGGTGVNINDKEDDTDALYFAADAITVLDGLDGLPGPIPPEPKRRDTIPYAPARMVAPLEAPTLLAGDTIKLFFNAADSTLKAFITGRPAPAPRKEFTFIAGEAADSDPALFAITWGKDGSNETVKLANKADDIYTAEILETVDSLVLVRCASDATEIIWDGEGKNVWNQTANYALCDTMYFGAWVDDSNLFTITCEAPKPVEVKYYVTGNAALVGEEKAWQADAIEMVDYTHTFPMLAAGEYQLKVTDGTWEHAWGYDNLSPTVAVEGLYTDVDGNICFNVYTPNDVTVTFAQGYVVVTGDFKGSGTGINNVKAIEGQRYNILGQPVNETYRGLVIMNGQTFLQK